MQLLIVDAAIFCRHQISLDRPPLRKKTLRSRTTSYRACSEINVIQPKCWHDKLNVRLTFYELRVFTDDIFSVFYSSTKSNASANVVAAKQQHRSLQSAIIAWFERGWFNVQNVPKVKYNRKISQHLSVFTKYILSVFGLFGKKQRERENISWPVLEQTTALMQNTTELKAAD